ncbi:MAG: WG repeat-containing protein [Chitinophagales bacterium]|nr:WG repeat-containing protein [Chitinophagales bacterium]MDW8394509.1 WG repeat-containing protein [Chitinophagales bacterium]
MRLLLSNLLLLLLAQLLAAQDASVALGALERELPAAHSDCSLLKTEKGKKEPLVSYEKTLCFLNQHNRQLDSAYFYLNRTLKLLHQPLKSKDLRQLQAAGCDAQHLIRLRERLTQEAYEQARRQNTTQAWNRFLNTFGDSPLAVQAREMHNEALFTELLEQQRYEQYEKLIADFPQLKTVAYARDRFERSLYEHYTSQETAAALAEFVNRYPSSPYAAEAAARYEQKLFEECVRQKNAAAYAAFIKTYPKNPYVPDAEDSLYRLITRDGKVSSYLNFIRTYPTSRHVKRAWLQILATEVPVLQPKSIELFLNTYRDFPYAAELRREARLMGQKFFQYERNGLIGYISLQKRDTIIRARFREGALFSEGLAAVRLPCSQEPCPYGYVSLSGRLIDTYPWTRVGDFSNGRAIAALGTGADLRYGLINHAGEWIIPPRYTEIQNVHEGLALVKDSYYGFVNASGEVVIPCKYAKASTFSDGLAAVQDPQTGRFGYIDRQGRYLISPKFSDAAAFREGLAAAADEEGRWGYIDKKGQWVIAPAYEFALPFINGKASVMVKEEKKNGAEPQIKSIVIDRQGRRMAP